MFINLLECIDKIKRLDYLIKNERTGTPKELAEKFEISERQIYILIEFMRNQGARIVYCRIKQTYIYTIPVIFKFGFIKQKTS